MTDGLVAHMIAERGALSIDAELAIAPGECVALVGPNGAGKSSIVRLLAGLSGLTAGRIALDGVVLDEPATSTYVGAQDRPIGTAFQTNLLFPHLNVTENVAFGLRSRGVPRRDARAEAAHRLDQLGVADLGDRRISELSGGQARRVSVARALAGSPGLVVLDEPFAGLDATSRAELRRLLIGQFGPLGAATLIVAHDPLDSLAIADRVVVLEAGSVVQVGAPSEIRARPSTPYIADLVGVNLLRGSASNGRVVIDDRDFEFAIADRAIAGPVLVRVEPTAIALHVEPPGGSPRNVWQASVATVHDLGDVARVSLDHPVPLVVDLTPAAVRELAITGGRTVWAVVKATGLVIDIDG